MRKYLAPLVLLMIVIGTAGYLLAHDEPGGILPVKEDPLPEASAEALHEAEEKEDILIENAYALPTSEKRKNGVAFMTIKNMSDKDEKIIAARSDIAERVEFHSTTMENGIMKMRHVESYDIPAGGEVVLGPSGDHIMLMGLTRQLTPGSGFMMELEFENAAPYSVNVITSEP